MKKRNDETEAAYAFRRVLWTALLRALDGRPGLRTRSVSRTLEIDWGVPEEWSIGIEWPIAHNAATVFALHQSTRIEVRQMIRFPGFGAPVDADVMRVVATLDRIGAVLR